MRALLLSVLVASACSSPRKAARTPAPTAKSYPAALYAGLFHAGSRYTYDVEASGSHWDDQDPRADTNGNVEERASASMTCTVTEVHDLPSAIASRVECQDNSTLPLVGDSPAGIYVATADGLWSVAEIPRVAPTTTKQRLFAWPPVASETDEPDPQNPGWGSKIVVSQSGSGWCRYMTFISGDDGDAQVCVDNGMIVSGSASSSGGSSYEMAYHLAKP